MSEVDIALAANGPYFHGLLVTACSMAMHANKDWRLRFHVLDSGVGEQDKRYLEGRISTFHPHCVIDWKLVDEKVFDGVPKWNGSYAAYTRLLLPRLLPDLDWCLYCDCDFTWMRDVVELWQERDDRFVLLSTTDGSKKTIGDEAKWFAANGLPFDPEKYFCSGLSFMNLKRFREESLDWRCIDVMKTMHPAFPDQTALNVVCYGRVKIVEPCWQRLANDVTNDELVVGVVIHHAGEVPWKKCYHPLKFLSDVMLVWHSVNANIRGITLWQSLTMYFSVPAILYERTLFWVMRLPLIRPLVKAMLFAIRHPGVWQHIERRTHRIPRRA